ncbi:ABC transporter permease [uncultured Agrococcus sp.]|uniref:ABC transporter permease n=1 Tax=uncultured Agrococcus sp. TaxID=382258 RepID=UPI0025D1A696|nr:ABC transporter permease [uncultured Agrococcus sp.]
MKSMRRMLPLALRMARQRIGAMLMIAFAVGGGAIMVSATGVLMQSGIVSNAPVGALAQTDVVVSGAQHFVREQNLDIALPHRSGVDPETEDQLLNRLDVDEAVGRIGINVVPVSPTGELLPTSTAPAETGANWSFGLLGSPALLGQEPIRENQVALSQELATALEVSVGDQQDFIVAGEPEQLEVTAVLEVPGQNAYFPDHVASDLSGGSEWFDFIGITAADGVDSDQLAASLEQEFIDSPLQISTGEARGDVAHIESGPARGLLIALTGSLGGTLVMTVGFIVCAAIAVSVNQQRREVALLRTTGATSRQVRWLVATQASFATVAALPAGIAGGYLIVGFLANSLVSAGIIPPTLPLSFAPVPGLATAVLMLVAVNFAARFAALRVSRLNPTEAIAESRIEPKKTSSVRTVIGSTLILLCLISALVPLFTRSEAAFISSSSVVLLGCIGLAMAGPAFVRGYTGARASRSKNGAVTRWLAAYNSHSYAVRTSGAFAVLALAIALGLMQLFVTTTEGAVREADLQEGNRASAVVTAEAVGGLSESQREDLLGTDEVTDAVGTISTTALRTYDSDGRESAEELAVTAFSQDPTAVVDLGIVEGDIGLLDAESFAMEAERARFLGISTGDHVELITDDGSRVSPKLIATYERVFGYGPIVTSTELLESHTGDRMYDAVLTNGSSTAIQQWAEPRPGVDAHGSMAQGNGGVSGERWVNLALTLVLLGYVVMAGGNTLVAATARRKSEFGLLRLIGATGKQVKSMMRKEVRLICVMATTAGLALSLPAVVLLGQGLLGRPWPQGPLWAIPVIVTIVCAIAYLAVMTQTRRLLQSAPIDSMVHE